MNGTDIARAGAISFLPGEVVGAIGSLRGLAVHAAAMALVAAETPEGDLREARRELYLATLVPLRRAASALDHPLPEGAGAAVATIRAFVASLPKAGAFASVEEAEVLLSRAAGEIVAAVGRVMDAIRDAEENAGLEQGRALQSTLGEMEEIGRMIGIISLNAAIEASRLPDAGGRTFRIVAAEMRRLSERSAELIAEARRTGRLRPV